MGVTSGVFADVSWQRDDEHHLRYSITPTSPLRIVAPGGEVVELGPSTHELLLFSEENEVYGLSGA